MDRYRTHRARPALALTLFCFLLAGCTGGQPVAASTSPVLARELTFYNWEGDMPASVLTAFTRAYGVPVRYLVYESQEDAIENIRAGEIYDVVVLESRFVPLLVRDQLLAELDPSRIPNTRNISANFRELAYDPGNRYSLPYNWGTTAMVVRPDLLEAPATRWADLWDPQYAGRVGLWMGERREVIGLALKSLGFSANSESPEELEAALLRLRQLRPGVVALEDLDPYSAGQALATGQIVMAMGYASDYLLAREENPSVRYVLPQDGALLWNDTFVVPANSPNRYTAELFLNFLMRPDINAQIANENLYATPNEAAQPLIDVDLLNNPAIYPSAADLYNAELILPLTPSGQRLYDEIWARFTAP